MSWTEGHSASAASASRHILQFLTHVLRHSWPFWLLIFEMFSTGISACLNGSHLRMTKRGWESVEIILFATLSKDLGKWGNYDY